MLPTRATVLLSLLGLLAHLAGLAYAVLHELLGPLLRRRGRPQGPLAFPAQPLPSPHAAAPIRPAR